MSLIRRLVGNAVVASALRGQREFPFLPEERLRAARDERTRRIVRHAGENVPYYRDLFRTERIDPRDIRSADDLERLPLIDRAVVAHDPQRFVSTSKEGRRSSWKGHRPLYVLPTWRSAT